MPIPPFPSAVIRSCDFDHNGTIDLFIGARVKNFMYPYSTHSWLIHNNEQLTTDTTSRLDLGMVTDAIWTDFDGDGWEDLIVAREWNSLAFLKNINGKRLMPLLLPGVEEHHGIWYSVASGDFDQDGDEDIIAGNIGENTRFIVAENRPLNLYAFDFEMDGVIDPLITSWWPDDEGIMREYPVNYLDELWSQSSFFESLIKSYTSFSKMTMEDLFRLNINIEKKLHFKLTVNTLSSYIIWNEDNGFRWEKLPLSLQVSPVKKIIVEDINDDKYPDVILGGNDHTYDVPTGYYDANKGFVLLNNGKGKSSFRFLSPSESGILLHGMVESLLYIKGDPSIVVAGLNRAKARIFIENKN